MREAPPPPRAPAPAKAGWRRAGRILLLALGTLVALLLVIALGALVWLHTGTGREELGRVVAYEARSSIKGDLRIKDIRVTGFLNLCVDGVDLRDPDGNQVIRADRLCLHVNPVALRANKVLLSDVRLEQPWIDIATVQGPDGVATTTLARAVEPRVKSTSPSTGPFQWLIDVQGLSLHGGALAVRPGLKQAPTFQVEELNLTDAHLKYAADAAGAGLKLTAQLLEPGRAPLALDLDAALAGTSGTGKLQVNALRVKLGQSGLLASGQVDLGRRAGAVELKDIVLTPADLEAFAKGAGITAEVRGDATVQSDGKTVTARAALSAGKGHVGLDASGTPFEAKPSWSVNLKLDKVDPGAFAPAAPHGEVSATVAGNGTGVPRFDEHGVLGDLDVTAHVGPARLDRMGALTADLKARLEGRDAIVKAFTGAALGLTVKAQGKAARDAMAMDVQLDAPDLVAVGRAVGALTKKPAPPLAGTLHLDAHVTGTPSAPQAQVHLRAPRLRYGPGVLANGLRVDGFLHGDLANPDGRLSVSASNFAVGQIALGAPSVDMDLEWPIAHLRADAGVAQGHMAIAGDATIDDDKDGLVLSRFLISYPGNEFRLTHDTNVHFRDETVIEPLELAGPHGAIRLSAQIAPKTPKSAGHVEAAVVLSKIDLERLPAFALPKDLGLHGIVDATAVVSGPLPTPDLDLKIDTAGVGTKKYPDVSVAAHAKAHVHKGRLAASGTVDAGRLAQLQFVAELPAGSPKTEPASAPLRLDVNLSGLELHELGERLKIAALQKAGAHGKAGLTLTARGTLGAPHAALSLNGTDLGADHLTAATAQEKAKGIQHVDLKAGVLLEKGRATLDGTLALQGAQALGLTATAPFELTRALKDPAYLGGALQRALTAEVAVSQLHLEQLAEAGVLPAGSAGAVNLSLRLTGTPLDPGLALSASGEGVTVGKVQGLDFQGEAGIGDQVKITLGAQAALLPGVAPAAGRATGQPAPVKEIPRGGRAQERGKDAQAQDAQAKDAQTKEAQTKDAQTKDAQPRDARGALDKSFAKDTPKEPAKPNAGAQSASMPLLRLTATLGLSGKDLVAFALHPSGDRNFAPLLDKPVNVTLEIPGLVIGRVAQLAGRTDSPAEGKLEGRIALTGTGARPQLQGRLAVSDIETTATGQKARLGQADLYVEADSAGALLHVGIDPPGGGNLLGHVQLKADLGGRTLLRDGPSSALDGALSGRVDATALDLGFLSGLAPSVRHASGKLDAHLAIAGTGTKPLGEGDAHLRSGVFDLVGQGIFEDIGLDAKFSPKEVVVDRLTGSTGEGTFSAILVAAMKPGNDTAPDTMELTGEVHLGDAESVRDRKAADGRPLRARPVPVRQAGEHAADVTGELDLFGTYADSQLNVNARIPDARVVVTKLPDKKLPALKANPDVLLYHPGERPHPPGKEPEEVDAEQQAIKQATLQVHAHLDLQHLYVKAEDFEFPVVSTINFEYDAKHPDQPTADGTVRVPQGSFSALGRRFTIQNALITETGGDIADPELEVKARFENSQAAVTINVSGSAQDPQIQMTSNPPMDQDAIAFFLATGRIQGRATQQGGGVDLSSAATSVLGGLLFGQVRKSLANVLPVDVLTIETGAGGSVSQASIGKYIGDRVFIGYRQRLTPAPGENTAEGRIEYEISRSLSGEATVGEKNSDLSILYTKDF